MLQTPYCLYTQEKHPRRLPCFNLSSFSRGFRISSPRKDLRRISNGLRAPRNWIENVRARTSRREMREYTLCCRMTTLHYKLCTFMCPLVCLCRVEYCLSAMLLFPSSRQSSPAIWVKSKSLAMCGFQLFWPTIVKTLIALSEIRIAFLLVVNSFHPFCLFLIHSQSVFCEHYELNQCTRNVFSDNYSSPPFFLPP